MTIAFKAMLAEIQSRTRVVLHESEVRQLLKFENFYDLRDFNNLKLAAVLSVFAHGNHEHLIQVFSWLGLSHSRMMTLYRAALEHGYPRSKVMESHICIHV